AMQREMVLRVPGLVSVSGQIIMPLDEVVQGAEQKPPGNPVVRQVACGLVQSAELMHAPPIQPGLSSTAGGNVGPSVGGKVDPSPGGARSWPIAASGVPASLAAGPSMPDPSGLSIPGTTPATQLQRRASDGSKVRMRELCTRFGWKSQLV